MDQATRNLAQKMADILLSKKAEDVVLLDISDMTVIAEGFLIASGRSTVQVKALADHLDEGMRLAGVVPQHVEGYATGRWIISDYGSLIVHIFHAEDREFYNIERLWSKESDSNRTDFS